MASGTDDFFGVNMIGFDPYHEQRMQKLQRYQALDSMLRDQGTQASTSYNARDAASRSGNEPQIEPRRNLQDYWAPVNMTDAANMFMTAGQVGGMKWPGDLTLGGPGREDGGEDGGWGGGGPGEGPQGPGGPGGGGPGGEGGAVAACPPGTTRGSDGTCWPNETGEPPGITCPSGQYWNGERCVSSSGGYTGGGGGTASYGPQIPADLTALRSALGGFLTGRVGEMFPQYGGLLDVQPSWSAQSAHNIAATLPQNLMNMYQGVQDPLMRQIGFTGPGVSFSGLQPALNSLLGGGAYSGQLAGMAQAGGADVSNWLRQASGMYGQAAGWLPWQQDNIARRAGLADASLAQAGGLLGQLAGTGPFMGGVNSLLQPNVGAINSMAQTGNVADVRPALDSIWQATQGRMQDTAAQIREQYGAMGLGAGSDVSEAVARGLGRELANANMQQQQTLLSAYDAANARAMQAQGQLPGLASAYITPQELAAGRLGTAAQGLLAAGGVTGDLMGQVGGQLLGTSGAYGNLGAGYGQLGSVQAGAAGTMGSLLGQAGSLSNAAMGTGLEAAYNQLMANPQLTLQSAALRNQALGLMPQFMNAQTSGSVGASGVLQQLGVYDSALQEGNINRAWQAWQMSQQPRYLNEAISYATGFPPALPKPIVQNQSGASALGGMMSGFGGLLGGIGLLALGSDRDLKQNIVPINEDEVLEQLAAVPVSRWQYIFDPTKPHVGPMAQDWNAATGLGNGLTIDVVDAFGTLVAAVKALKRRVEELEHAQTR